MGTRLVLATLAAIVAAAPACSPDEQPDTATIGAEAGAGGAPDEASGGSSGAGGSSSDSAGTPGDGGVPGGEAGDPSTPADGVSARIGAEGGSIELDGAVVTIPPTALAAPTRLTLKKLAISPPGYELYSSVFALLPRDTSFALPVTIKLPFAGDAQLGTVFSGRRGSTGYSWAPTLTTDDSASVEVAHAGTFFVANGVAYVDAPDTSCSAVDVLDGAVSMRREVTLLAQADDCQERPLVGLSEKELRAVEDGESTNATVALRSSSSSAAFVVVLVDVAALKSATEDVLGALRGSLLGLGATARIGLSVYGGAGGLAEIVAPTLDRERLAAALDALVDVPAPAPAPSSFEALSSTAHAVA